MNIPEYNKLNGGSVTEKSISVHYPEFHEYILNNYPVELSWAEKLYWYYNNISSLPSCCICGAATRFVNIKSGYRKYCSRKCLNSDPGKKELVKQTCMSRYGGAAPACSREVREKMEKSNTTRYGVKNAMQNKDVAKKSHTTNINKYGGCGNASPELKKKQKETINKLFGVNNYMQSEYFYELVSKRHPDIISIDVINKRYECVCPDRTCSKCTQKSFYIPIRSYNNRKDMTGIYKCTTANPIKDDSSKDTCIELFVKNILNKNNIYYISNTRNIISPLELDIYIPDKKIAIECNGIYYHNSTQKDKNYHTNKYKLCELQGIQLLSFWEDWIYKKPQIVENILLSKLGLYRERIYARNCNIVKLDAATTNLFLDTYHIQGSCPSDVKYGLYYESRLVCLMTFANRRNNIIGTGGWELVRFCSVAHTQVIGGAQKLLSHFIREYDPECVTSFASNDISNGNLYDKLGFIKSSTNQSYWYIDSNFKRYHRTSFTKSSIIKRGWKYTKSGWTEASVMKEHNFYQIYDSGQTKWVLNIYEHQGDV